jgi:hypothetical protein
MTSEWDDDGDFESLADHDAGRPDLDLRDPFDLSKALEGAALEHLRPDVKRMVMHTEYTPSGDQPKAIENLISQLEKDVSFLESLVAAKPSQWPK